MTAPDELKPLLDERGIEYYAMPSISGTNYFFGWVAECGGYTKCVGVQGDCYYARLEHLTPAQAIEVTMGREECHNTNNVMKSGDFGFRCSVCGSWDSAADPMYCHECGRKVVDG